MEDRMRGMGTTDARDEHGLGKHVTTRDEGPGVRYVRSMDAYVIERADGRDDGEDWADEYTQLPGDAGVSLIFESTIRAGVGPRLHQHPYAETFIIRRGSATFTIAAEQVVGHAGQVLVVPAHTPHTFRTAPGGYEAIHVHASPRFITEWLE